jgi:hypothetical protein
MRSIEPGISRLTPDLSCAHAGIQYAAAHRFYSLASLKYWIELAFDIDRSKTRKEESRLLGFLAFPVVNRLYSSRGKKAIAIATEGAHAAIGGNAGAGVFEERQAHVAIVSDASANG